MAVGSSMQSGAFSSSVVSPHQDIIANLERHLFQDINLLRGYWPVLIQRRQLFSCIKRQWHLVYDLMMGEAIEIHGLHFLSDSENMYLYRDASNQILVIIKHQEHYVDISQSVIREWDPTAPLKEKINQIIKNVPSFIEFYLLDKASHYQTLINENDAFLKALPIGGEHIFTADDVRHFAIRARRYGPVSYRAYLETNMESEPFIRFDSFEKEIYRMHQNELLKQKDYQLILQLKAAKEHIEGENNLPEYLADVIDKAQLLAIYEYLLNLENMAVSLERNQAFHIKKENSHLSHTVSFILKKGEWVTLVGLKRKKLDGTKDNSNLPSGATSVVKKMLRIDERTLPLWADKAPKQSDQILSLNYESWFSHSLSEDVFNQVFLGNYYVSLRKGARQHLYSKYANHGDLLKVFTDKINPLSEKERDQIIVDILTAAMIMHEKGKIFQDFKFINILIDGPIGQRRAKITDFVDGYDKNSPAPSRFDPLATPSYESPQISYNHDGGPFQHYHNLFHSSENRRASYGYQLRAKYLPKDWSQDHIRSYPDPKNDMFSIGVLIYGLLHRTFPHISNEEKINQHFLFGGLLAYKPEERWTARQALEAFQAHLESKHIAEHLENLSIPCNSPSP